MDELSKESSEGILSISEGSNVLLVEDDVDYARSLIRLLSGENFKVVQAKSYEEAIQVIGSEKSLFDVIVLDQNLDGSLTGLDTLVELKKIGVMAEVIVLTGVGSRQLGIEMLRAGAFRYFTKQSENDDELIYAIQVASDFASLKRSGVHWSNQRSTVRNTLIRIFFATLFAIIVVVLLNYFASENFLLSSVVVVILILVLALCFRGLRKLKMTFKNDKHSIKIEAETD